MSEKLISETVTVDAPPAVVFAIVADPDQHARIDGSGSVRGMVRSSGPVQAKGDSFQAEMKLFGLPYKITNRIVEFEPDRRVAWRHFGGHRWRYLLEPTAEGGTEVTEQFDYTNYPLVWRTLIEAAGFPDRNRKGISQTLVRLKDAAEADASV